MGLLGFTKKSRKQGQTANSYSPFTINNHVPEKNNDYFSLHSATRDFKLETSVPKETGTSLMDDIMNELDSARSITSAAYQPSYQPSAAYQPAKQLNNQDKRAPSRPPPLLNFDTPKPSVSAAPGPAYTNSEPYALDNSSKVHPMQKQQQQRPKPLIHFSNSSVHSDMEIDDDEPIHKSKKPSPPSSSSSVTPVATTPKNLMDRMKERHRLEARRSLQPSPFMESPSDPLKRPLVQSHSFTMYNNQPVSPKLKRPIANMVKSASFMNDSHIQSEITFRTAGQKPSNRRHSYMPLTPEPEPIIRNQLNRSTSAFLSFPQEQLQQQQQQLQIQQQMQQQQLQQQQIQQKQVELQQIELQQQQQKQQLLLQQQQQQHQQQHQHQLQQQIEIQQQQLQEQQLIQQQKLQQLQYQQQQQQLINQAILESTQVMLSSPLQQQYHLTSKPLYERKEEEVSNSSTSTLTEFHYHEQKPVQVPIKIKRELQDMQLRKSSYSVPDLSDLAKETRVVGNNWDTIEMFNNKVEPVMVEELMKRSESSTFSLFNNKKSCSKNVNKHSCCSTKKHKCMHRSSSNYSSLTQLHEHTKKHHHHHHHHHNCKHKH